MTQSPVVGEGNPLYLAGSNLYLNRLWFDECEVAKELLACAGTEVVDVDIALLRAGLNSCSARRPRGGDPDHCNHWLPWPWSCVGFRSSPAGQGLGRPRQWRACWGCSISKRSLTASNLLALPWRRRQGRQRYGSRKPSVTRPPSSVWTRASWSGSSRSAATTLHRLLGRTGGDRTRFRHNRANPLRHDVVVVDETSMVVLSMMARLLEALRPDARLIIVGDPEQLVLVEAGAVLGDIVGPASRGPCMSLAVRKHLEEATGHPVPGTETAAGSPIGGRRSGATSRTAPQGRHRSLRPGGPGGRRGHRAG